MQSLRVSHSCVTNIFTRDANFSGNVKTVGNIPGNFRKKDRKHSEIFRSIGLVHGFSNKKMHIFTTVAERNVPLHFVLIPIFLLIFLGAWNTQRYLQAQALWDTLLIYTNVIIKNGMIPERYKNFRSEISGKFPIGNFGKLPRPIPTYRRCRKRKRIVWVRRTP